MRMFGTPSLCVFVFAGLFLGGLAKGQNVEEPMVKFGMEILDTNIGIKIVELEKSRPIAKKLKEGDILLSTRRIIDGKWITSKIISEESVDEIKSWIREGERVLLTVLRMQSDSGGLKPLEIEIDAMDLMRPVEVKEINSDDVAYSVGSSDVPESVAMIVKVYYATDRKLDDNMLYSGDRDTTPQSATKFGFCEVSIPPGHRRGQLESPTMFDWRVPNPKKHVFLAGVSQIGEAKTFESIKDTLNANGTRNKSVLLFVHGYNVNFDDAARRSAQLHFDLNFPGVSMFFSWPSNGTTAGYVSDSEDIAWSTKHIEETLEKLSDQREVDKIHIVAHSMGNRGVTAAILGLASKGKAGKIGEVVLAAADIDSQIFERDIAPKLCEVVRRTSIYSSAKDRALWASESLSKNPRVGEVRNGLPTLAYMKGIDLIDASSIETDLIAHSYYGDCSFIGDLYTLLESGSDPPRQMLTERSYRQGKFWQFKK